MKNQDNLHYITRNNTSAQGKRKVFLSYRKKDIKPVNKKKQISLIDKLAIKITELADVAVWYDNNLTGGENYNDEIQEAISQCDAVILLLTKGILDSDYVWDVEIKAAQDKEKPIIPIAYSLSAKHFVDVEKKLNDNVQILNWEEDEEDKIEVDEEENDSQNGSFDSSLKRALDRFVLTTDTVARVNKFFKSYNKLPDISDLSGNQLFLMGVGYLHGVGTDKDNKKGIDILDTTAHIYEKIDNIDNDNKVRELRINSALELAKYYSCIRKPKEVYKYNDIAASNGSAKAMYYLGDMCYYGKGVEKDRKVAADWYRKAADTGESVDAMYSLGKIYYYGRGAEQDLKEAEKWYTEAANKGNADAMCRIAQICKMEKGTINKKDQAGKLFIKAAEAGSISAMAELGKMYRSSDNGQYGIEKDIKKAVEWFTKAIDKGGSITAYNELADMYMKGEGVEKNLNKARELYEISAEMGSNPAQNRLNDTIFKELESKEKNTTPVEPKSVNPSPARWLIPAAIILLTAAALCGVQLSGAFDIIGWLGSLLQA